MNDNINQPLLLYKINENSRKPVLVKTDLERTFKILNNFHNYLQRIRYYDKIFYLTQVWSQKQKRRESLSYEIEYLIIV